MGSVIADAQNYADIAQRLAREKAKDQGLAIFLGESGDSAGAARFGAGVLLVAVILVKGWRWRRGSAMVVACGDFYAR